MVMGVGCQLFYEPGFTKEYGKVTRSAKESTGGTRIPLSLGLVAEARFNPTGLLYRSDRM